MSKGIKIAKTGKTVADGVIDMSMTSLAQSLKISKEETWSQAVSASYYPPAIEITHGLGYVPKFRVYGDTSSSNTEVKEYPINSAGDISAFCYADTNKLYILIGCGFSTATTTINGYYYICEDAVL
jgi:hypothetical protein